MVVWLGKVGATGRVAWPRRPRACAPASMATASSPVIRVALILHDSEEKEETFFMIQRKRRRLEKNTRAQERRSNNGSAPAAQVSFSFFSLVRISPFVKEKERCAGFSFINFFNTLD
jgi:hypothetical protein